MGLALLTGGLDDAMRACQRLYAANQSLVHGATRPRPRIWFAHRHIYPAWVAALVTPQRMQRLDVSGARLLVAISRPARRLGLTGSVALGLVAYAVAKHLRGELHPTLPQRLGLRQEIVEVRPSMSLEQARSLLEATAAAVPFMRPHRIANDWAIDGGYTDHVALPKPAERQPGRTLVLLTRRHDRLPSLFRHRGRLYWQPSKRVPISTWDCRPHTDVAVAYAHGCRDVDATLGRAGIRPLASTGPRLVIS